MSRRRIPIEKLDDNETYLKDYHSLTEAAKKEKVPIQNIHEAIKYNHSCRGFRYRYKDKNYISKR